jgi:superfamily II DNA or RNA helicase
MSDAISAEHRAHLEELGIGTSLTPKRTPVARFQRDEPAALFAPPPVPVEELNLTPLYPYQQTALERVWEAIEAGETRIMVMLPTGGGKTVLAAHIFAHKGQQGKVSAFPVPLLSLIKQTFDRFKQYGLRNLGVIQARHKLTRSATMRAPSPI